ncbi:MAG: hypothetical protein HOP08_10865 [Cyclobacteriaceae bacterium]|nr:hypothetical protein [Cyclobacteriaceae bacterium]
MSFISKITNSNFFIKVRSWEYWPFGILQAPIFPYWLWLSLKSRSIVYFSASNPGILMGGMFGESKFDVLELVPAAYKPRTILIKLPNTTEKVLHQLRENGLNFPLIFKPDLGERGWMVRKIKNIQDVEKYLSEIKIEFLAQELVELPLEFGVFYVRYPIEASGKVTSIVGKEMLFVKGDGKKTLKELMLEKERAKLQWKTLKVVYENKLAEVIPAGEKVELVSIGNHCLGTKFLNENHLITDKLSASFDHISKQIEGFYFGRFDLRAATLEDLENGNVRILELNGCGAEPAHIYDPRFSFFRAVGVLWKHWSDIYRISSENHKKGVAYISFREAKNIYKKFKALTTPS